MSIRFDDLELLDAVRDFTLGHEHLDAAARQPDSHELVACFE